MGATDGSTALDGNLVHKGTPKNHVLYGRLERKSFHCRGFSYVPDATLAVHRGTNKSVNADLPGGEREYSLSPGERYMSKTDTQELSSQEFSRQLAELRSRVERLPEHPKERIDQTADRLRGMSFDFHLGTMEIHMFEITRGELLDEIDRIAAAGFGELRRKPNFEEGYSGGDEERWANYARLFRIRMLVDKFELLSRLRDDEPEAWDEVEELYVDD